MKKYFIFLLITIMIIIIINKIFKDERMYREIISHRGQIVSEYYVKNGKLEGVCKDYYKNGQLSSEENYKNGKLEGLSKWYYENGKLMEEVYIKNGKEIYRKSY